MANAFLASVMCLNFHSIKSFHATADRELRDEDRVLKRKAMLMNMTFQETYMIRGGDRIYFDKNMISLPQSAAKYHSHKQSRQPRCIESIRDEVG